ncbi:hypothetical protein LX36DRAFT_653020 [Colletotrichum falcatum]|nr:hypothetical protein LX36DRAFT_653020 [Colletotrichum falcatum]
MRNFDGELRNRNNRHRQVRLTIRGSRRVSTPDSSSTSRSRFTFSRPRPRSDYQGGQPNSDIGSSSGTSDFQYFGIQSVSAEV